MTTAVVERRKPMSGILHQHYRVYSAYPRVWVAECKVCKDTTHKAMTPEDAEKPMVQHLKDKHEIEVTT